MVMKEIKSVKGIRYYVQMALVISLTLPIVYITGENQSLSLVSPLGFLCILLGVMMALGFYFTQRLAFSIVLNENEIYIKRIDIFSEGRNELENDNRYDELLVNHINVDSVERDGDMIILEFGRWDKLRIDTRKLSVEISPDELYKLFSDAASIDNLKRDKDDRGGLTYKSIYDRI